MKILLQRTVWLHAAGFGLLAFYCLLAFQQKGGWGVALAGVAVLLVANADRLRLFKMSATGLEAEFREVIEEARAKLSQLQELALIFAEVTFWGLQANGRWGGTGIDDQQRIRDRLLAFLKDDLAVPEGRLAEMASVEHPYIHFDYAHYVTDGVTKNMSQAQQTAWSEYWGSPERKGGIGKEPDPTALEAFLTAHGFINEEVSERLRDYHHWHARQEHRRPSEWSKYRN